MVLLDTDVVSIHQRTNSREYPILIGRIGLSSEPVFVGSASFEEQMRGWQAFAAKSKTPQSYVRATEKLRELLNYYTRMSVLDFDGRAAVIFEELKRNHPRAGTMDLRIAAIALAHGATHVTRNVRDFAGIPSLRVEDWTKG